MDLEVVFSDIFYEVSSYYGVEGAFIGGVGSNPHVHVDSHNEVCLAMTPSAPMLSGSFSSLSMGEKWDRGSIVGCYKKHEHQDVSNIVEEVESVPPLRRFKRQIVLPAQYRDGNCVSVQVYMQAWIKIMNFLDF